ncbi:MAG: hypothetical protein H7Z13_08105 [Ferruginibacter sp.]|nr:hypothetical protein [Ferruginibacter sp.]
MAETKAYYPRKMMASLVFGWLFLILVYFFSTNSLLSQLQAPVLISPQSDNTYWMLHIFRIPQWLLQHYGVSLAFDIILTVSCITCIFVPDQRFFTWITVAGVWLLYICYCSAAGKHYAQIGYLLAPIPFLALRNYKFDFLWDGLRYWVCFLYVGAGIFKLYYGGFASPDNMSHILEQMNADWFIFNSKGMQADTIRYLIDHPGISQWLFRLACLADLSLLVGFFTKKFDKWLLFALVIFHLGNLLLLHISFIEQSLIFAPFLPWQRLAIYFHSTHSND